MVRRIASISLMFVAVGRDSAPVIAKGRARAAALSLKTIFAAQRVFTESLKMHAPSFPLPTASVPNIRTTQTAAGCEPRRCSSPPGVPTAARTCDLYRQTFVGKVYAFASDVNVSENFGSVRSLKSHPNAPPSPN